MNYDSLIERLLDLAIEEDISTGDISTEAIIPVHSQAVAEMKAKADGVISGLKVIKRVYERFEKDIRWEPLVEDGTAVKKGDIILRIGCSYRTLLLGERLSLNILQRMSGIATATAAFVKELEGTHTQLLDTRKTTPGLRVLEKYAFACGGGYNHRIGLFDRVMLKDNHLAAAGAVDGDMLAEAVRVAKRKNPDVAIEVEVDRISQIQPVLDAEADVIMLDNFSLEDLPKALGIIGDKAWTEVSGGVTLATLPQIGKAAPDFVSSAAPIHSSSWIDIGLDAI